MRQRLFATAPSSMGVTRWSSTVNAIIFLALFTENKVRERDRLNQRNQNLKNILVLSLLRNVDGPLLAIIAEA